VPALRDGSGVEVVVQAIRGALAPLGCHCSATVPRFTGSARAGCWDKHASADVFLQNLVPGAAARLDFEAAALRARHPRLITCDISGCGEEGPLRDLKAYDLLVQAESGLVAVSGAPSP
jgi:hypothetical protein